MQFSIGKMIKGRHNSITLCPIDRPITIFVTCGRNCATLYSCVHNQIATFGLLGRQSVTLNIGCSHNRNNRPSEQSAKCNIGQALEPLFAQYKLAVTIAPSTVSIAEMQLDQSVM